MCIGLVPYFQITSVASFLKVPLTYNTLKTFVNFEQLRTPEAWSLSLKEGSDKRSKYKCFQEHGSDPETPAYPESFSSQAPIARKGVFVKALFRYS